MIEEKDYLKRQIDMFSKVLAKCISILLGIKGDKHLNSGIESVCQILESELDIDINSFILVDDDSLVDTLMIEKGFNNANLDSIAEILMLFADNVSMIDNEKAKILRKKSLVIYEYLEINESTYSLCRHLQIDKMRKD
ncbi:hypothetical protein [Bacteroides sedimenti]|uniref:Uncharacterized protein n=1 Tax=Bacteroides sedimenti TaxID=2136147 RepID=A0ABN6Z742_9BACE